MFNTLIRYYRIKCANERKFSKLIFYVNIFVEHKLQIFVVHHLNNGIYILLGQTFHKATWETSGILMGGRCAN